MLINLSNDEEILECLASDDEFLEILLRKLMVSAVWCDTSQKYLRANLVLYHSRMSRSPTPMSLPCC
jgi:hypothetical protein